MFCINQSQMKIIDKTKQRKKRKNRRNTRHRIKSVQQMLQGRHEWYMAMDKWQYYELNMADFGIVLKRAALLHR